MRRSRREREEGRKEGARRAAKDSEGDEGARLNEGIQAGAFLEGELPRK